MLGFQELYTNSTPEDPRDARQARRLAHCMAAQDDITALLHRFREGDDKAKAALIAAVYDELKVMAARYMRDLS